MLTVIDHIIIGVNDLERGTGIFGQRLGMAVSGGGIHPSGGTANRIIVTGDTYLELITVRAPAEAEQSLLERLAKGEGFLNFVLASNDIEADSRAMTRRGISSIGPTAGELRAANGRMRGWSRTNIERPDLAQHYPFIIQHDSRGEERRFRLAGWSTPPEHPLGVKKVLSATIAVADLGEAPHGFQHIYRLEPSEPFSGEADGWDAMLVSFPLGGNDQGQSFELAEPLPLSAEADQEMDYEHLPEPGALSRHLQEFGESLCRMTLEGELLPAAQRFLDAYAGTYTLREGSHPALWVHHYYTCCASSWLHQK